MRRAQQGSSLLVVLVLLAVMALAALSLAGVTSTSTALAGNASFKTAALQASEAGISEAFASLQALTAADLDTNKDNWYYARALAQDASGLPSGVDWNDAPKLAVGNGYAASYVVERLCTATPVTDPATQCFLKRLPASGSAKAGSEQMDSPSVVQFRLTIYVQGPKGTKAFVQSLATGTNT
jgi:Tfp pilus assembly protein PilX